MWPGVRTLYKKLLALYPRGFRERLEESMEQTFNDLYKEKRQTNQSLFGFITLTFTETSVGIVQEHILLIQENYMKNFFINIKSPAIISFALIIPFIVMESVNRRNFNQEFPFVLFGFLWVLPIIFITTLMPIVRNLQAGNNIIAKPIIFLLQVIVLTFIGWMWISIVVDQMPCFLGVPNCD
jgi:hypothetical protein